MTIKRAITPEIREGLELTNNLRNAFMLIEFDLCDIDEEFVRRWLIEADMNFWEPPKPSKYRLAAERRLTPEEYRRLERRMQGSK